MIRLRDAIQMAITLFLVVVTLYFWDSERSKRIELEAELDGKLRSWIYISGKTYRAFAVDTVQITIYPDGTYDIFRPDSMDLPFPPLAESTVDSSEVTE